MAKPKYSRDYEVHFTPVRTSNTSDDDDDDDDLDEKGAYITQSLISEHIPTQQKLTGSLYSCCPRHVTARTLVITTTLFFLVGLIVGLTLGRIIFHSSQSRDTSNSENETENKTNCGPCSDLTSTETYNVPSFSSPSTLNIESVPASDNRYTDHTTVDTTNVNFPSSKSGTSSVADKENATRQFPTPLVSNSCASCKTRNPKKTLGNESSESPFAPLTMKEMMNVEIALKIKGFVSRDLKLHDDRISHIYLHPALKSGSLDFLDNNGSFPGRFAKVHVFRPKNNPPDVMEYRIGPLNESSANLIVKKLRQDGEISFNRRPYDVAESNELYILLHKELNHTASLLFESFDEVDVSNFTDVYPNFSYLPASKLSDRTSHMVLILNLGESSTLYTLPVSCTVHHPGINVSDWYTSDWFYLNQGPYHSSKELQEAYDAGKVKKVKFPPSYRKHHERDFDLLRNKSLPARDLSGIPPPRTYEPQGPRYTIKGHRVSWMGWQFDVSSDPVRGPAMFDVRFNGQRIAYEISLQDITLLYSSQTNGHGPLALSDTFFLIGSYNEPIFGVDCPKRASVLKTTSYLAGSPIEMDALCVFEADGQRPLWRHGSRGLADHYLVIRAPINLDNYDYIFECNFYLDGRMQTLLTASGYLYGAFLDLIKSSAADERNFTPFGYKLGDYLLGPIHDHTFTFKIDLDILGTANSFEALNWKAGSTRNTFQNGKNISQRYEYYYFNKSRYIVSEILEQENSFILDPKQPMVWTVVNEDKHNCWGVKRGYRVIPHSKYAEILQDHMMLEAWNQLKYQIAVTKRKETEPYATNSLYDLTHPTQKLGGNDKMKIDGDKVRKEDLVLWISEKFYHLPTSEDVPMTLPAQTGFILKPFNYFDRTPTFDLPAYYSADEPYDPSPCFVND